MRKKAIIVSGYFNPIHKGHLEYFNNAKESSRIPLKNNETSNKQSIHDMISKTAVFKKADLKE